MYDASMKRVHGKAKQMDEIYKLKQALAKKDGEIELRNEMIKAVTFDCIEKDKAYQQLMELAVAIAQGCIRMIPYNRAEHEEAIKFLASQEAKAFLKEREYDATRNS